MTTLPVTSASAPQKFVPRPKERHFRAISGGAMVDFVHNAAPVDSLGVSFVLAVLPLAVLFVAVIKLKVRAQLSTW